MRQAAHLWPFVPRFTPPASNNSGLESGHRNPTVVTVYELAVALGVSHIDLLRPTRKSRK
jgi:hypothetical protein